ncbi:sacsin N-terminal ATP-binding-like domain-containing protein [Cyclobacterium jeungdonense]|uniref:Uncharacterized protein n=1 Tax=Cyclobacterium jeungdonense TaxID=708087 RepID=A0ABT8C7W1_9BACT|nr:hypothetical protein [Cyclobacterium jeungdonense]MDN3688237.1 hypothetical protein [Cyclobacterium jeungdonense]
MKTQKEVIEFLKIFWEVKALKFQAQFAINQANGQGFFYDIRHPNSRDLILHPLTKSNITLGVPRGVQFEEGTLYWVNLNVPKDQIRIQKKDEFYFHIDLKFRPPSEIEMTPQQLINQISGDFYSTRGKARSALTGFARRISSDLNRKPETFIFELIQNADDYPDSGKNKVNIRFQLKGDYILVTHNGLPFSAGNVNAICDADSGNKQFDPDKIGYKGIGFKSIFKLSNYVLVHSGSYSFRFDEDFHRQKGIDTVWQLIPIWTPISEMPIEVRNNGFTSPNVAFCIKLKKGKVTFDELERVFETVFVDERVLLFLRNVKSISFSGINLNFTSSVSELNWEVSKYLEIEVDEKVRTRLNALIGFEDERVPEKYKDLQFSNLKFATKKNRGVIEISDDTKIYTYLPTDESLGFPFLMNGDFIPDGSRNNIHSDLEWNLYLFEEGGKKFVNWLEDLSNKYKTPEFLKLIPDFGKLIQYTQEKDKKLFLERFQSGFEQMLSEVAFLPDLGGNPQKIMDLTVDKSGLLSLLGEENFRKYLSIEGPILALSFSSSHDIKILLEQYEFGEVLTHDSISSLLKNEEFAEYLLMPDQNLAFVSFLNEQGVLSEYSDQEIFLSKNGDLKCEDEVYFSLGEDASLLDWLDIPVLNEKLNKLEFLKTEVKKYSPLSFIKKEILGSTAAKANAKIFKNNRMFFQLLFKHHEILPEKEFFGEDQFRAFPVFDRESEMITDFNSSSLYLSNTEINQLIDDHALPESMVTIIDPKSYFSDEVPTDAFWAKLGVADWSEDCALPLAKKIFSSSTVIHKHFSENLEYLAGSKQLWKLIYKTLSKESGENENSYKEKASKLPVFTSDEDVKSLGDCYLSADYTGTNSLETLYENHPEIDISFISKDYIQNEKASDWSKIFRTFGVKTDAKDFIGQYILPEIESVSENDLVSYTQLIFENRSHFKNEIAKIKIKVKTEAGTFIEPKEAIIGSYYSKESQDKNALVSIPIQNLISSEYGDHLLAQWAEFFESMGAKVLKTEEDTIQHKLDEYVFINEDVESSWEDHQVIIQELNKLHEDRELTKKHYSSLNYLSLFTKEEGIKSEAFNLFFSSEFNPNIDFEKIIDSESLGSRFISPKYLEIHPNIKSFLNDIGVFQNFRIFKKEIEIRARINKLFLDYLETKFPYIKSNAQQGYGAQHQIKPYIELDLLQFMENYEFNKHFWESFLKDEFIKRSVFTKITYRCAFNTYQSENLILWTIQNQKSIPCQDGELRKPSEIYSNKLKGILFTKEFLPLIDLSEKEFEGQPVEKLLGFKMELDLIACISVFNEKPSISSLKKSNVWQTFIKIVENSQFTGQEREVFEQFLRDGSIPNQLGDWKPITELYYIDQSIDIGITKAPNLIHDDLKKIASKITIPALTSEDFKPQFKNLGNDGFKERLLLRLKFIALLELPDDLDSKKFEFDEILNPLIFYKANKIELACQKTDPPIVNTDNQFLILDSNIYYLRSWKSVNAAELFEYLGKLLRLKKVNKKTLIDLLILSEDEVIELLEEKNISYPPEWKKNKIDESQNKASSLVAKETKEELINEIQEPASNYEKGSDAVPESNSSNGNVNDVGISDTEKEEYEVPYSQEEEAAIMRVFGDNAPKDFRKDLNLAALIKGLSYLYHNGYNISEAEQNLMESHHYSQLQPVYKDGITYTIKCRSAKSGLLYLKASAWKELEHPNTFLYSWIGPSFSDAKFCKSREEVIDDLKADYQVLRIEAKPSVSVLDSFMDGAMDLQEVMLIVRTKFKEEYRGIFEDIRKKSKTDSLEALSAGNEDED